MTRIYGKKIDSGKKVSIGFPVYNGEEFLRKKMDSLLEQTFSDFEIIISDNCSTDKTCEICKEYEKNDDRVRYFRQEKNFGPVYNYNFVLQKAKYDYFVWTAADDVLLPKFLEKNLDVLEKNENFVGSMTKQKFYGIKDNRLKKLNRLLGKMKMSFRPYAIYSIIEEDYEKRLRKYMKGMPWPLFYGVFRTDVAKKSFMERSLVGFDGVFVLNILKFGKINLVNEPLFVAYGSGGQSKGMIYLANQFNENIFEKIFPYYPFVSYMSKNIESKIFWKNLDVFMKLIFDGTFLNFIDVLFRIKSKISKSAKNFNA